MTFSYSPGTMCRKVPLFVVAIRLVESLPIIEVIEGLEMIVWLAGACSRSLVRWISIRKRISWQCP
jgi:hypothetical protein